MNYLDDWQATPRSVGVACAVGATLLGFVFMMMGGAPIGYLGINFGALVIGLLLFANFANTCFLPSRWGGGLIMAAGLALVVTALFGIEVEGIARWIKLGPLSIQPSLVLLPMMIVAFARSGGILATSGIIAAAIALALQPDRAMAAALAAGMIALLVMSQGKTVALAAMASIVGFIVAMVRPDPSPAVPFVDQIIFGSFDIHALAALSVAGGLALLVLPAFAGMRFDNEIRTASLVFGVTWAAVIIAAALGNYPTPVVGYSGGAVLGYVLSLAMLPKTSVSPAPSDPRIEEQSGSDLPANRSFILQPT